MHQVGFSLHDYIETNSQQNIKKMITTRFPKTLLR